MKSLSPEGNGPQCTFLPTYQYHHPMWQYHILLCTMHHHYSYTPVGPGLLDRANTTGSIGAVYIMSSLHHVTPQIAKVIPTEVDNVVDTTGTGDAFLGGLIMGK